MTRQEPKTESMELEELETQEPMELEDPETEEPMVLEDPETEEPMFYHARSFNYPINEW